MALFSSNRGLLPCLSAVPAALGFPACPTDHIFYTSENLSIFANNFSFLFLTRLAFLGMLEVLGGVSAAFSPLSFWAQQCAWTTMSHNQVPQWWDASQTSTHHLPCFSNNTSQIHGACRMLCLNPWWKHFRSNILLRIFPLTFIVLLWQQPLYQPCFQTQLSTSRWAAVRGKRHRDRRRNLCIFLQPLKPSVATPQSGGSL